MSPLSNPFRPRDATGGASSATRCRPAQQAETKACLRLLLGHRGRLAGDEQVVDFLRFSLQRGINLNDLWLAERQGQILWAVLPVTSPGRTALLLAPSYVSDDTQAAAARELVGEVCTHCAARGVNLAQALLDPNEPSLRRVFEAAAFDVLAELVYLQAAAPRSATAPALPAGLTLQNYARSNHAAFAQAIERSYQDSLDCPALTGKRDIEDIIAGHKAAGEFDPKLWYLLRGRGEQPLGVLLLSRSHGSDSLELVYLGLCPEGRGQGLGDLLMHQALADVGAQRCANLTLAVDALNAPALKLYYRHGLRHLCSKLALIRDLRHRGGTAAPSGAPVTAGGR